MKIKLFKTELTDKNENTRKDSFSIIYSKKLKGYPVAGTLIL